MKATLKNFRYYLLIAFSAVAFIGICGTPDESLNAFAWVWVLLTSKIIGFGSGYLAYRLFKRWEAQGTIPEMTKLIKSL
jgi:hypothetical protein